MTGEPQAGGTIGVPALDMDAGAEVAIVTDVGTETVCPACSIGDGAGAENMLGSVAVRLSRMRGAVEEECIELLWVWAPLSIDLLAASATGHASSPDR